MQVSCRLRAPIAVGPRGGSLIGGMNQLIDGLRYMPWGERDQRMALGAGRLFSAQGPPVRLTPSTKYGMRKM